jgi:addiction module RelE/StbE family toxin
LIRFAAADRVDLRKIDQRLRPRAGAVITDGVIQTILAGIARLDTMPLCGRPGRRVGTRELVITRHPYIVIYRVVGNDVEIARILHTAQQWPPE